MKLLKLEINNFKGLTSFVLDIDGASATVFGDNATGKTTIYDAFLWLLFGKDSTDRKDFCVKPLGADGKPAHSGVETHVKAMLYLDGNTVTLERVYSEKWEKKRGQAITEMTGNTTAYYVDDLPVKQSKYKAYVDEICSENTFKSLTSTEYFCGVLPWREQRRVLFEIAGGVTEEEIFDCGVYPELADLRAAKGKHSVEEFQNIQQKRRATLSKELDGIPARVDEASRGLVSTAVVDRDTMNAEIATLQVQRQQLTDMLARSESAAAAGLEAEKAHKRAELTMHMAHNARWQMDRREKGRAQAQAVNAPLRTRMEEIGVQRVEKRMAKETAVRDAAQCEKQMNTLRKLYVEVRDVEWNGEIACPTCKHPYAADEVNTAKTAFQRHKQQQLDNINAQGRELRAAFEEYQRTIQDCTSVLCNLDEEFAQLQARIVEENPCDVGDMDDYTAEKTRLEWAAQAIEEQLHTLRADRRVLTEETNRKVANLDVTLAEKQCAVAEMEAGKRAQVRVEELMSRQKKVAAELEDAQRYIALCDMYTRAMVRVTENCVDGKFELVKWNLFVEQINGGIVETCVATVDGVPYTDLNHAMRINAGLDVIQALCAHFGVTAPVFVDNAESVTRLANVDMQLIRLVVSAGDNRLRTEKK